jgi:hypothetical protein
MPDDGDSMITGSEFSIAARAASIARRVFRRPDPVAVIKRRQAMRDEIEARLRLPASGAIEIVVIRVGDEAKYPNVDSRFLGLASPPWRKFEVKGFHDRGLEVNESIRHVRIKKSRARRVHDGTARKVFVVGRIPYERIAVIDWNRGNDRAYNRVRFYVACGWRGPSRDFVLYDMPDRDGHLAELRGVKYKASRVPPWTHLRWAIEDRRERKQLGTMHRYDD